MGHKKWTAHHDLWAKAFQRNHGTATAASHAEGVLKVVWPGHSGAVPDGTLQAHFHATGHLHASCGAPFGLSASADMQIHVTLTPFERAPGVGGLPPAVPNLDMTWTAICNVVDDIGDVFDVVAPMPGGLVVGDRYMFTIDWTNKTVAESVITDTPVADASAMFPSTGDFFSDSTGDPGIAIDFDVPDPPLLACPLNVVYFRGACATGTVGAPCNVDADCGAGSCAVTAAIGDDQTVLKWPTGSGADVYRGLIPTSGAAVWTISGGNLTLNNAACLGANVVGDTSGPLSQVDDPNPAAGTSLYYQVSFNDPAGTSINAQGCALPAVCNNAGWCELGTTPGMPCNVSLDCAGGGICLIRPTPCAIASGGGDVGGCALHATCAGGANAGRLCFAGPDCPGSSCTAVPAGTVTPGQICYSIGGAGCEACPTAGNPARLGRLVPIASMCP